MALRRRTPRHLELDVSAFADVAFLLIIFFILTTTFVKPAGSKLDIPAGETGPVSSEEDHLQITLAGETIRYGRTSREVSIEELRTALLQENLTAREPNKRIVLVKSENNVPYGLYYKVVMAIDAADGVLALIEEEE